MATAVTIAASGTASGSVDLTNGVELAGIELPATKTGTGFALHVSRDNSTFLPLYGLASAANVTGVASTATAHYFEEGATRGWGFAKIVAASAQSAQITIQLLENRQRRG